MHPDQQQANQRALAAALGLPDEEACERLEGAVQLTWNEADRAAATTGRFTKELLARTFEAIGTPAAPLPGAKCEVLLNATERLAPSADVLCATILDGGFQIVRGPPSDSLGPPLKSPSSILCLLAACFVSAAACSAALQMQGERTADCVELDFDRWPGPIDFDQPVLLPPTLLAGAGAVGNSVAYALTLLPISGAIAIADPKKISGGILGRCLLFDEDDVQAGAYKADTLANRITQRNANLKAVGERKTVRGFRSHTHREIELLIVGVDSRGARRELQEEIPFEVFDASTTGIDEVVFHHNRLDFDAACMGCIYVETPQEEQFLRHMADSLGVAVSDIKAGFINERTEKQIRERYPQLPKDSLVDTAYDSLFRNLCATEQLVTAEQKQVLAPFGFVSQLAGTILAIELYLRQRDPTRIREFNYWRVSPWRSPIVDLQQFLQRLPECRTCSDSSYQQVSAKLLGSRNSGKADHN